MSTRECQNTDAHYRALVHHGPPPKFRDKNFYFGKTLDWLARRVQDDDGRTNFLPRRQINPTVCNLSSTQRWAGGVNTHIPASSGSSLGAAPKWFAIARYFVAKYRGCWRAAAPPSSPIGINWIHAWWCEQGRLRREIMKQEAPVAPLKMIATSQQIIAPSN